MAQTAKEASKRWKALGDEGKKSFHEQAVKAKVFAFLGSEEGK